MHRLSAWVGSSFDALINRDKPAQLFLKRPLMVHEALASIRCSRLAPSASPTVPSAKEGEVNYIRRPDVVMPEGATVQCIDEFGEDFPENSHWKWS